MHRALQNAAPMELKRFLTRERAINMTRLRRCLVKASAQKTPLFSQELHGEKRPETSL